MNFDATTEKIALDAIRLRFAGDGQALTWQDVIRLWKSDERFCAFFSASLANTPFEGFAWETPALFRGALAAEFECVITSSPDLATPAQPRPFAQQLAASGGQDVISFPNLGGDATLVAPCDLKTGADYAHLAGFLRTAPASQLASLWRCVGETAEQYLARSEKVWISTAGLGVAWLHVRFDARPKYYRHGPYRSGTKQQTEAGR